VGYHSSEVVSFMPTQRNILPFRKTAARRVKAEEGDVLRDQGSDKAPCFEPARRVSMQVDHDWKFSEAPSSVLTRDEV
jgi:hypothetical protein